MLLCLSIAFYKERLLFLDHAYYLFQMIAREGFAIFHYRFISVFNEVLPFLAIKLSMPLQEVMLAYSMNIILFHLLCYIICGLLRDYLAAIGLLLFSILFATHTFYFAISEMIQATALLFPFIALMRRYATTGSRYLPAVLLLFIPIIAFAHPLMVFPVGFMLAFFWLDKDTPVSTPTALWIGGAYVAVLLFKTTFFKEPYESNAFGNLRNFKTLFPDYFTLYSNKTFLINCFTQYYWIPVSIVIIAATYVRTRQWLKLGLFAAAFLGYLGLINISYPGRDVQGFYIENLYTPLAFFLALPLAYDALPLLLQRRRVFAWSLLGLITVSGVVRIYAAHEPYTARVDWMRRYLDRHEGLKIMANEKHAPMDTLLMSWATPYEFWLISTEERNRTASIIFSDNIQQVGWGSSLTYDFVTHWGAYSYDSLDKRYFKFADSFVSYTVLP
jgi:hypothetical protein